KSDKTAKKSILIQTAEVPPHIHVNVIAGEVESALLNIMINAIKHGYMEGESGTITISASRSKGLVHVDVENDGSMIPYSLRGRLMKKRITSHELGQGIGLVNSARNLARFGGTMELLCSEPGKTIFRVSLQPIIPLSPVE
ncbi:TPA: ATP-binding protein, partial [Candidatus Micrarchaeota archaeon]|nr:ATP-binding protein [Candidatus Micrarchaeota archaeon]